MNTFPLCPRILLPALFLACWLLSFQNSAFALELAAQEEPTWKELDANSFAEAKQLQSLLKNTNEKSDLARIKLTIDKMIDPSVDIEDNLKKIDDLVSQIRAMLADKKNPSDSEKMNALRQYIYDAGPWNNYQPFHYDLEHPEGTYLTEKLLPVYISTKKGNCISMPILFAIVGQRIGLDVTLSTAPTHVFVKYTDRSTGSTINIETTSGGHPAREEWISKQSPMTDKAIQAGMYMKRLSKQEAAAVIGVTVAEYFRATEQYRKAIILSEILLQYYPVDAASMTLAGDCFARLADKEFIKKYPRPMDIPTDQASYYRYLRDGNQAYFSRAENLGWQPETAEHQQNYLQTIQQTKSSIGLN